MAYGRSYGLPIITTQGNNVYGPNQFLDKLIPKFINSCPAGLKRRLAKFSQVEIEYNAESVGLKDYDHLEPCRIFHATRLVVILEAYALYDSEISYCQGMSDLLSPIILVMEEDHDAFWCFIGFMKKTRYNF
ncbi:hypothetical protein PVL29_024649 [Vitis rotundifolia]|uniref:Rab-GAP TBC domain-containing protein n=1 Tax=Vitis rotundifolia TaxID=103349 RepID=A0AA39D9C2_VITRO|nr:hypothetical protein PVL29_024649 [Vitis rotundifolia]